MIDIESLTTIKETFKLPSKGLVYGGAVNPEITLRSMTTAEEMALTGFSENEYKKMADVIETCIVGEKPAVHVYDMIMGDYIFLLHKLRIVTYGSNYPLPVQCPNCHEVSVPKISLDDLEVREFDAEEIGSREITLPVTKLKIKLGFTTPRAKDVAIEKSKEFKKKKKTQGVNYDSMFEAMSYITKVDNETVDETTLEALVWKLPTKDMKYIIEKGRELDGKVGLGTLVITTCPECGYEFPARFQYNQEFLNPQVGED